jgi:hypothetical protein
MALRPESSGKSNRFDVQFLTMKAPKSVDGFIKISRAELGQFIGSDEVININNPAFEKNFSVGGSSEATVKSYLTEGVVEALLALDKELITPKTPNAFDFIWKGNEILMRVGNDEMFKPALLDPENMKQRQTMLGCMSYLKFILKLSESM